MKDRVQYYKTLKLKADLLNESDQTLAKALINILRRPYYSYNEEFHLNG
ncbi:hypothetical protein [Peribacillus kribbensis]|nr:hypothetical protein [Peribacillus kribbensis]